jgi:beta-xylosidase
MPEQLAYDKSKTTMHYKGITSAPANFSAWGELIGDLMTELAARYGLAELRTWRFEVWVS